MDKLHVTDGAEARTELAHSNLDGRCWSVFLVHDVALLDLGM